MAYGYELVNFCEFDKYAVKSYCAIHNESEIKNLGDITKVDENKIEKFNVICGGSPCQDFSVAGKQKGSTWSCEECGEEYNPLTVHFSDRDKCPKCGGVRINKTRSSLLVEWLRVIRANRPDWGIYENVKNIVGKQFKETTFKMLTSELQEYGYNVYYKVLNAKNYGIPQNRERVYLILIKKEIDNGLFAFPGPFDNGIRLKDILEENVEEKFYIRNNNVEILLQQLKNKQFSNTVRSGGRGSIDRHCWDMVAVEPQQLSMADVVTQEELKVVAGNKRIGTEIEPQIIEKLNLYEKGIKGYNRMSGVIHDISGIGQSLRTVTGGHNELKIGTQDLRIRKLTPLECFRLMGFTDKNFNAAVEVGMSNAQLYKQAGNSIVTDVLFYIYLQLYKAMPYLFSDIKLSSYFSGIGAFEIALDRFFKYLETGVNENIYTQINNDKTEKNAEAVLAMLTPDRLNKRQNGRRFKENGEEAFTITAQDRHGVCIIH